MHQQRLHGLDFLRATMMLLGIVLHGAQMYMTMRLGFDYYIDPMQSPVMDGILIFINTFRMPVFFFLSGFFTALLYQRHGVAPMVKNRYQRIVLPFVILLPPLAVILTLQWVAWENLSATGTPGLDLSHVPYPHLLYNNTHHLWFLYYLMFILAIALALLGLWRTLSGSARTRIAAAMGGINAAGLPIICLLGLSVGWLAIAHYSGRINGGITFFPYWRSILYFGVCFGAGWALWYRQEALATLERRAWPYLGLASLCFVTALAAFFVQGDRGTPTFTLLHPVLALMNGLSVAFYIAGFTGLFSRLFSDFNPRIRYLSDSAYWVYILHQPALLLFAMPMYGWNAPAGIKFLIVCTATTALCLWTYDLFVRDTRLGVLLNGRTYPRGLPLQ